MTTAPLLDTTGKSTPHIQPNGVPIAGTVLLPGDPLRAELPESAPGPA